MKHLLLGLFLFVATACTAYSSKSNLILNYEYIDNIKSHINVRSEPIISITNFALIDHRNGNYVYRSGNPVINGVFQYSTIISNARAVSSLDTNDVYVISFNLLNYELPGEEASINTEASFWAANSNLGRMVHYQPVGAPASPYVYSPVVVEERSKHLSSFMDDLPTMICNIRNTLLNWTDIKPLLIYIHCSCGCDRTGMFSAAWYMQYQGHSLSDSRNLGINIIGREMVINTLYGTEWYCYYLKYSLRYPLTCNLLEEGAILLPTCQIATNHVMTNLWKSSTGVFSQWSVTFTNTNSTPTVFQGYQVTQIPSQYWGININNGLLTLPTYQTPLNGYSSTSWGYITSGANFFNFVFISPSICLVNDTAPPIADITCHISYSQSFVSSYTSGGITYRQWNIKFINTSPKFYIYDITFNLETVPYQFWNLNKVNGTLFSIPNYALLNPNGSFTSTYVTASTPNPLNLELVTQNYNKLLCA